MEEFKLILNDCNCHCRDLQNTFPSTGHMITYPSSFSSVFKVKKIEGFYI